MQWTFCGYDYENLDAIEYIIPLKTKEEEEKKRKKGKRVEVHVKGPMQGRTHADKSTAVCLHFVHARPCKPMNLSSPLLDLESVGAKLIKRLTSRTVDYVRGGVG